MELRSRGWSILSAAREVGVSRTTGNNWSRGYKVYRRGDVIKGVAPLDHLAVREVSARYLSQEERVLIADLVHARHGVRSIARQLGRSPSTISRELHRNVEKGKSYRLFEAHRAATGRRARAPKRRLENNPVLAKKVGELLSQRWSPQQIIRHLRTRYPDQPGMWLCHESIYQAIYQPGSVFLRPTPLAPHRRSPLRTGREHRRAHHRPQARRARFQQPMLSVHERPTAVADRGQSGHWEDDLIVGKDQGSAIGTLVERTSRLTRLLHLPLRDSDALHDTLIARMSDLPAWLLRSITWDQGSEMAQHLAITAALGSPVYFCDSHSPWQRPSNENTNGLLRDYFPKGSNLSIHTPEHLLAVENELNNRPRQVLRDQTPAELFTALLACESPSVLRRWLEPAMPPEGQDSLAVDIPLPHTGSVSRGDRQGPWIASARRRRTCGCRRARPSRSTPHESGTGQGVAHAAVAANATWMGSPVAEPSDTPVASS